jgi:hypothetical protein
MQDINLAGVTELIELAGETVHTVTDLTNLFLRYKSGERAVAEPTMAVAAAVDDYPQVLTNQELLALGSGLSTGGKAKCLMSDSSIIDDPAQEKNDTVADIFAGMDSVAKYKKTGDDQWTLQ